MACNFVIVNHNDIKIKNHVIKNFGGAYFETKLTFKTHLKKVCSTGYRNLGFFTRNSADYSGFLKFSSAHCSV